MDIYKFGDIPVCVKDGGTYFGRKCVDYLAPEEKAEFDVSVTEEDIRYEAEHSEKGFVHAQDYLKYIAIYRKFCERALNYDVVLCHGSVVEVDGRSYMFTAPSGTGKSTHTRMWRQHFGDRAVMVNDDKPLLKFKEDGVYVYGTPWDGKHHLSTNKNSRLAVICFLSQAKENEITKISAEEAVTRLMHQIYRPRNAEGLMKTLDYVDELIRKVPMYKMGCTISEEAAEMAYNAMSEEI